MQWASLQNSLQNYIHQKPKTDWQFVHVHHQNQVPLLFQAASMYRRDPPRYNQLGKGTQARALQQN